MEKELKLDSEATGTPKQGGVLATLIGPCADLEDATRNDNDYSQAWATAFEDEFVKEYFENGGLPGELDHPKDRIETLPERIAVVMRKPPYRDGRYLIGKFDVLNTPLGRVTKELIDAGLRLGVSSRADGQIEYTREDGTRVVSPENFHLKGFDIVLLPAVKDARLSLTESVQHSHKLLESLEALANSEETSEGKKLILDSIEYVKNNAYNTNEGEKTLNENSENANLIASVSDDLINLVANSESVEASVDTSVKELQESLVKNAELTNTIISLRNELAVANSKVNSLEENVNNYREVAKQLSRLDKVKCNLDERCKKLQENFKTLRTNHETLVEKFNETEDAKVQLEGSLNNLKTDFENKMEQSKTLEEKYKSRIQFYRDKVDRLVESLNKKQEVQSNETSENALNESINASNLANKELTAKNQQLTEALNEANSRANNNSKKLDKAISKYLEVKSIMTGVDAKEVERRLPKEYTFEDIDGLYESLQFNKDTIVLEKVDVHSMRKNNLEPRNASEEEFQDFVMSI